jgi:hypothetical protein
MNQHMEFSLNMDNPQEAALYDALADPLRHRRAGEVIRQVMLTYLFEDIGHLPKRKITSASSISGKGRDLKEERGSTDDTTTRRILKQSAAIFGFDAKDEGDT